MPSSDSTSTEQVAVALAAKSSVVGDPEDVALGHHRVRETGTFGVAYNFRGRSQARSQRTGDYIAIGGVGGSTVNRTSSRRCQINLPTCPPPIPSAILAT
jgi:hypothetical protein